MKLIILTMIKILANFGEDLLILSGLSLIVWATFTLSWIGGMYALGFTCLSFGLTLARRPPRK